MKYTDIKEINSVLARTLDGVVNREISTKRATLIVKIAKELSRNISQYDLEEKILLLENILRGKYE